MWPEYAAALAIQALAFCVFLYRFRAQTVSPDGRFYSLMGEGQRVPQPYSRRWLLPMVLGWAQYETSMAARPAWTIASGVAFVATGPLIYALTGSLACVWFCAWLPGLAVNVRFPVLVDQVAFSIMLGAVVAYQHGLWWVAIPLMLIAGQCKETAPVFGGVLCWDPYMAGVCALSMGVALVVGKVRSIPGDKEYQLHPFRVAMTKHDPLSWVSMVLPWGGIAVVCVAMASSSMFEPHAAWIAGVSLVLGYGQLLLANDESRLFVWAAPAALVAIAGYQGAWLVPALVAHPWMCGATKRV